MAAFRKEDALKIIHQCAVLYNNDLSGNNIMFITLNGNIANYYETLFLPQHFLHLTGITTPLRSEFFYKSALNQRLSPSHISFDAGGTSEVKLNILPKLMSIHINARMVGDYDNSKPLLVTDKFAGTVTMAMGFKQVKNLYVPNTALKMDIREVTTHASRHRIIAIFVKPAINSKYKQLTYIAKGINIDDDYLLQIMQYKIDLENVYASFKVPFKFKI